MASKLDTMQFGALKGRSTTHALVAAAHMVNSALDRRPSARMLIRRLQQSVRPSRPYDRFEKASSHGRQKVSYKMDAFIPAGPAAASKSRVGRVAVGNPQWWHR
jgi:hypothetical protein